jgi:hypothetical protein
MAKERGLLESSVGFGEHLAGLNEELQWPRLQNQVRMS